MSAIAVPSSLGCLTLSVDDSSITQRIAAAGRRRLRSSVQRVTDTQTIAGAIIAGLTTIAGAIRWSSGRIAKSQDRGINAIIENVRSHATLTAKFDSLMARFESLAARFDGIVNTLLRDANVKLNRDPRLEDSQRSKATKEGGRDNGRGTRPMPRATTRADADDE